jgi:hypothetical protein
VITAVEIAYDLSLIPTSLHGMAMEAIAEKDVAGLLCRASNTSTVDIVLSNWQPLRRDGLLESALVQAFTMNRGNNHHGYAKLDFLTRQADRARLRAAGDPLPSPGPWTVYRGVAGHGRARRIRGFSWTADCEKARWFANRGAAVGLAGPAVFSTKADESHLLFFTSAREESEYVLLLTPLQRCDLVPTREGEQPRRVASPFLSECRT